MLLSLREPPVRSSKVSCDVGCCSSFHFCSSFCCCCSSHCFSTSSLTFPWNIAGFLHTFYTFSPAHRRAIRDSFILSIPRSSFHSFTASATVLSGHFLPTGVFYLTLLHRHFTYVYQGIAGSRQLFFEFCSVSCWSSKHRLGPSVCFKFNLFGSVLNSTKYYHELLVVKVWFICSLLVSNSCR